MEDNTRSALALVWHGGDGSEWLIHGRLPGGRYRGDAGVFMQTGTGLVETAASRRRTSAARQDGSTLGTWKTDERIVTLDVVARAHGVWTLDEVVERWRTSWHRGTGRLVAHTPAGVRWLNLDLESTAEVELGIDPHRRGIHQETVKAVGADPYAHSERYVKDYTIPGSGELTIPMGNPTSALTYPTFTCTAGEWELPDGVDGATVPLAESAGTIRINTDPLYETVTEEGRSDGWRLMLGRGFRHWIPPYTEERDVVVRGPAGGSVRVSIERRWLSLW